MSDDQHYTKTLALVYQEGHALLMSLPMGHPNRQTVNELLQSILALVEDNQRLGALVMEGGTDRGWRH